MKYEYECQCGFRKEQFLPVSKRNNTQICDMCNKPMTRLLGYVGLAFKGTDWYTNDVLHKKTMQKQAIKDKKARQEGKSFFKEY